MGSSWSAPSAAASKRDFLKVDGKDIVVNGKPIILKGAGLGGWSEILPLRDMRITDEESSEHGELHHWVYGT